MKCPRCGLVHTAADQVCRRCEIDLRTGEPTSRANLCAVPAEPAPSSLPERLAKRIGSISPAQSLAAAASRIRSARPSGRKTTEPAEHEEGRQIKGKAASVLEKGKVILELPRRARDDGVKKITCAHCGLDMSIARTAPYSLSGPVALILIALLLGLAALAFPLLAITAVLSGLAGIGYLREGSTYWKCASCGFTITRAR